MTKWLRFERDGRAEFGTLADGRIAVHEGDMFAGAKPTGESLAYDSVRLLTPCEPSKMVALWNNYKMLAEKLNLAAPEDPLYFIKSTTSFLPGDETVRRPASYDGKVIYEGELGIVIGKRCSGASESEAAACIFGYTCVNDVTAVDLLNKDKSFAQWTRAKSFDGFGVFGPVIATGLDPMKLVVRTILNGQERQNYPVSDIVFPPPKLVSLISQDMTLLPGDVIACGTNVGVGTMKEPKNSVEVAIEGIGALTSTYVN